ncbi:hypothetical protein [Streptomyces sp. NPDC048560]|uniref:hypothetical protein n=1 Tax=Streptomyces sp. NPDC048560 TaxID=3155488 RepID=UPI00341B0E0F
MNSTAEQAPGHQESRDVVVAVTGCAKEDARTVFDVLRRSFLSDRPEDDEPQEASPTRPTVWFATVDVSETRTSDAPAPLTAPVLMDVQGGYWAVDRFRKHLAESFAVRMVGTAAGDQEEEVRLELANR